MHAGSQCLAHNLWLPKQQLFVEYNVKTHPVALCCLINKLSQLIPTHLYMQLVLTIHLLGRVFHGPGSGSDDGKKGNRIKNLLSFPWPHSVWFLFSGNLVMHLLFYCTPGGGASPRSSHWAAVPDPQGLCECWLWGFIAVPFPAKRCMQLMSSVGDLHPPLTSAGYSWSLIPFLSMGQIFGTIRIAKFRESRWKSDFRWNYILLVSFLPSRVPPSLWLLLRALLPHTPDVWSISNWASGNPS